MKLMDCAMSNRPVTNSRPRMATAGGASALLVFPPAPFALGQSPAMALAHFRRIADATDLPIIVFQYPLASGQSDPREPAAGQDAA